MLILTFIQRKRNAHRLIIACHAELLFAGFDALGSVYAEHVEVLGSSKKLGATGVRPQSVPTIGE